MHPLPNKGEQWHDVQELCKASIEYSDKASTNLLIKILGGPAAITAYARTIHDQMFRLDRGSLI
ncbi:MAG: serine hydrolase [Proteobacteria bacterium]|nr:serine hydrolase [Pseudomonadota bacterium]